MGHLLLLAELRGLICSGPPRGSEHTYVLLDAAVPPGPADDLDHDEAVLRLTHRFVRGHGPVGERDLARWSTLTLGEIRTALARLASDGAAEPTDLDGQTLWLDPSVPSRTTRNREAHLLPTFDEAHLTYLDTGFGRERRPGRSRLVTTGGGGVVVIGGWDVGAFTRRVTPEAVEVTLRPDGRWSAPERSAVAEAAARLGAFIGRPTRLVWA